MPEIQTLNLPAVYGAVEDTKSRRMQNRLYGMQIDEAQKPKPVDRGDLQRAMNWADTEPKWNQAIDIYVQEGHTEFERYRGQFGQRNELMALLQEESGAQKPSTTPKKVKDPNSPTGYSWRSPSGDHMPGAPAPTGTSLTVGDDGTVQFTQGTAGPPTKAQAGKQTIDLQDQRIAVINFAKASHRLLTQLEAEGAGTLSFTGAFERGLDDIVEQGRGFIAAWGEGSKLDKMAKNFKWSGKLAKESAAVKSKITSLAYTLALAKNGTRPTDEDVINALKMLGESGSVNKMSGAVQSMLTEAVDEYSTRHKEAIGEDWDVLGAFEEHGIPVPGRKTAELELIKTASETEVYDMLAKPGLSKEEIDAIDARLKELGF